MKPADPASARGRHTITDPRTMRALAHPVRIALLEVIRRDGEITASRAAELLGESPGNMSWHLQTLAKYGFVEEAEGGRGRRRPWKATRGGENFDTGMTSDPELASASETLERTFLERAWERLRNWQSTRASYSVKWRRSAFITHNITYLTDAELASMADEVTAIYARYSERDQNPDVRPDGALPVSLLAIGHPIPPTAAGN